MVFFAVEGQGDPNTSPAYQEAMEILYGLSFTVKMSKMGGETPEGYFEYVVLHAQALVIEIAHLTLRQGQVALKALRILPGLEIFLNEAVKEEKKQKKKNFLSAKLRFAHGDFL